MAVVYRHFSASGELLYIGASVSFMRRTIAHSKEASWFKEIATITVQHFPDIASARKAEALAIKSESPRENFRLKQNDLFRKKMPRKPVVIPAPHAQIDALMKEYDVGYPSLAFYLGMTEESVNEIISSGRQFAPEEIRVIREMLGATYKRLARIGIVAATKTKGK